MTNIEKCEKLSVNIMTMLIKGKVFGSFFSSFLFRKHETNFALNTPKTYTHAKSIRRTKLKSMNGAIDGVFIRRIDRKLQRMLQKDGEMRNISKIYILLYIKKSAH